MTELSPTTAQKDFHNLYQEVIAHLVKQYGAEVEIHLSVAARLPGGFDEATQRVVTENGNVLGASGEFE